MEGLKENFRLLLLCLCSLSAYGICPNDSFPLDLQGDWYSIDRGMELHTSIQPDRLTNEIIERAECSDIANIDYNWRGHYVLLFNEVTNCYQCLEMYIRTINVLQYRRSTCVSASGSGAAPTLAEVCNGILPHDELVTMFRIAVQTVNCIQTLTGINRFSYEMERGGGGICDSPNNVIVACQQPGSVYVDNQVFSVFYSTCPADSTSMPYEIRFQCMGTWYDDGNYYSAIADIGRDQYRERFRCMLTRFDQQLNARYYSMSRSAECSVLRTPYDGPYRFKMWPAYIGSLAVPVFGKDLVQPRCSFPRNFTGSWYVKEEFGSGTVYNNLEVVITHNSTHIHSSNLDWEWTGILTCMQQIDTRYLIAGHIYGQCGVSFVCYEFVSRDRDTIIFRMGSLNQMSPEETASPDWRESLFRRECTTWPSDAESRYFSFRRRQSATTAPSVK